MAIIKSSILTNKGKDAVTRLIANEIQLTFKRIELSEQDTSSMQVVQIEALEALTGVKQHGTINTVSKNNPSEVTVYTLADNQNGALPDYNSPVTTSYTLRTVGLFANDGTEDFLYEVLTFSVPDTVPTSEISYNQQFNFTTVVGNSENIQIIVSPAGVVTTDMLKGISITGKNGLIGGGTIEQSREITPDYGVSQKKILEGHRLKQVLGVDEFGELNNSDVKTVGNAYWDDQTAEMYICTASTDKNYADADFFEPFSNSALLGKLQNLIYYGSLGGNGTGVNRKITKLGIFHYCDSTTTNGEGETRLTLPEGWKVLFATTQERDNTNYGATKVWLRYYYGENYVTVRYVDAIASSTAFQCVIFAYKD